MRKTRQDPRWPDAHERLKRLYEERAPEGMTQEQFGAKYAIGNQGMVWQYLNGWSPLNVEAAAKFARGLNCTIYDISPAMAKFLKADIFPVLGRAAMVSLLLAAQLLAFSPAQEADFAAPQPSCVLCQMVREFILRLAALSRNLVAFSAL